ncbi:probable ATP-dependent RNA helicase DDX56 [Euwallacea similis]|uniref:probable ATP-dependent RNA helicase DDX56 n=1 Tax=Euwallacea similis TaxID=1736056 RepID=UPI00344EB69D
MDDSEKPTSFHVMELDDRVLKAIEKLGWGAPTLIQEKAIPFLLEGKDVLVRARTGSGKTAAFAIPIVQKILNLKQVVAHQDFKALILAPSQELCQQIHRVIKDLTLKCSREVKCIDIAPQEDLSVQKPLLIEKPDIIVATPARCLQHCEAGNINLKTSLEILVIDEADLVFSFGYEAEVKKLLDYLPSICQSVLVSATLSEDVKSLKKIMLHNPVTLSLQEPELPPASQITHYHIRAEELEKATILYALLKLHLIRGKTIIFVQTVDKCYKIKLFLEQFRLRTCVLNSELPSKIRCHSVNQFNQGVYDIIVASDEKALEQPDTENVGKQANKPGKFKRVKDRNSGVSRGIDFQFVSNVVNFDFPLDIHSYIHRAGRTARGNNQGSVLSFVSIRESNLLEKVEKYLQHGQENLSVFKSYEFNLDEVEAFKYRAKDAWKAVTKIAVREARLKEIKQEIFNCNKLKTYFEDNPTDLQVLRHDKALHTVRVQQHLSNVPEYIVPETLKSLSGIAKKGKGKRDFSRMSESTSKYMAKKNNPLVSMQFEGFKKKVKRAKH